MRKNLIIKLIVLLSCFIAAISIFVVKSYAYYDNDTWVSDNKFDFNNNADFDIDLDNGLSDIELIYENMLPVGFKFSISNNIIGTLSFYELDEDGNIVFSRTFSSTGNYFNLNNIDNPSCQFSFGNSSTNCSLYLYCSDMGISFNNNYNVSFTIDTLPSINNNVCIVKFISVIDMDLSYYIPYYPFGYEFSGSYTINENYLNIYKNFYTSNLNNLYLEDTKVIKYSDDGLNWVVDNNVGVSINQDDNYIYCHFTNLSSDHRFYMFSMNLNASYNVSHLYFDSSSPLYPIFNNRIYYQDDFYVNPVVGLVNNVGFVWDYGASSEDFNFNGATLIQLDYDTIYKRGFEQGQKDSNATINVLKDEIAILQESLQNGLNWKTFGFAMVDIPFKTVFNMMNFDVLGVNLLGVFVGLITVLAILWIIKKFTK